MNNIIKVDFQQKNYEPVSELTPVDRLKLKMDDLAIQTNVMRSEIATFKASIKSMDESLGNLKNVWIKYNSALADIKTRPLQHKSRRLAQIMDNCLQTNP